MLTGFVIKRTGFGDATVDFGETAAKGLELVEEISIGDSNA